MRHLIDFGDLSRQEWDALYQRAGQIIDEPEQFIDVCRGKVAASLYDDPDLTIWRFFSDANFHT